MTGFEDYTLFNKLLYYTLLKTVVKLIHLVTITALVVHKTEIEMIERDLLSPDSL